MTVGIVGAGQPEQLRHLLIFFLFLGDPVLLGRFILCFFACNFGRRAGSSLKRLVDGVILLARRIRINNLEFTVLVA